MSARIVALKCANCCKEFQGEVYIVKDTESITKETECYCCLRCQEKHQGWLRDLVNLIKDKDTRHQKIIDALKELNLERSPLMLTSQLHESLTYLRLMGYHDAAFWIDRQLEIMAERNI